MSYNRLKYHFLKCFIPILFLWLFIDIQPIKAQGLKLQAEQKLDELKQLMQEAETLNIDVKREASTVYFAELFLKCADWDESNKEINERIFGSYAYYSSNKTQLANDLPDMERQGVIDILDGAIGELTFVIAGDIIRRPVPDIDWANITVEGDSILNNGKPVFLYDYFSKSGGSENLNDYLGAISHPWNIFIPLS